MSDAFDFFFTSASTFTGTAGNDWISGSTGSQHINGGAGDDIVDGGTDLSRDFLRGGSGHDVLNGGSDDFVFTQDDTTLYHGGHYAKAAHDWADPFAAHVHIADDDGRHAIKGYTVEQFGDVARVTSVTLEGHTANPITDGQLVKFVFGADAFVGDTAHDYEHNHDTWGLWVEDHGKAGFGDDIKSMVHSGWEHDGFLI